MTSIPILKENEEVAIKRLKDVLSSKFRLIDFRLFGSKVSGKYTTESDIDIFVEVDKCSYGEKLQIYDIVFDINIDNDTFISVTIFSWEEIEYGPMSESQIYKVIQREGLQV